MVRNGLYCSWHTATGLVALLPTMDLLSKDTATYPMKSEATNFQVFASFQRMRIV